MPDIVAIAEAGLRNSLQQLETVSRNVANANTQAYKREIHLQRGFESHFAAAEASAPNAVDFSAGPLQRTGAPLDFAIEGEGFFQLHTPAGPVLTRDGRFRLDRDGQLVAPDGAPVAVEGNAALNGDLELLADGSLRGADGEQVRIEVISAAPSQLVPAGPGRFRAEHETPAEPGHYRLRQGYIEGANTDHLREMVDLMGAVRGAQSAQQLLRAYDEAIGSAVSTLGQF